MEIQADNSTISPMGGGVVVYCPWCQGVQDKYISDLLGFKAYPDGMALEKGQDHRLWVTES